MKISVEQEQLQEWFKSMLASMDLHKTAPETKDLVNDVKVEMEGMKGGIKTLNATSTRIEKHVKYTNGCVGENRKDITKTNLLLSRLTSGVAVIMFLVPILSGIFVYFLNDFKSDVGKEITIQIEANNHKFFEIE